MLYQRTGAPTVPPTQSSTPCAREEAILLSWSGSAPQPLAEESGGIQPARCFIGRKVSEQDSGNYSLCCAFGGRWSCVVFAVQVTPQES
ncbi:hypothetical protein JZ751_025520, partial [Albula glossodonta]